MRGVAEDRKDTPTATAYIIPTLSHATSSIFSKDVEEREGGSTNWWNI
jgi:hypothetical protein